MNSSTFQPRCLEQNTAFPYKNEILDALTKGFQVRKDDRVLSAEDLYGTYKIRQRVIRDAITSEASNTENLKRLEKDVGIFLQNLEKDLSAQVRVWYVKTKSEEKFYLIENDVTGEFLGCIYGEPLDENNQAAP